MRANEAKRAATGMNGAGPGHGGPGQFNGGKAGPPPAGGPGGYQVQQAPPVSSVENVESGIGGHV